MKISWKTLGILAVLLSLAITALFASRKALKEIERPIFRTPHSIIVDCAHDKYTVRAGDTLDTVANKYEIPKEIISNYNGLTQDKIKAGMQLVIPVCYPTPSP